MAPTVTVVTPSFNQGRYLEETIRSVLAQRSEIHEYFVMDGGSTDGTLDIIRKYAGQLDYWVSEPDGGQAQAIDAGFRRATGEVLYWINSDDVLLPGAIAAARSAFEARDISVLTGWDVMVDAETRVLSIRQPPRQTLTAALWGILHVSQPTCFFKRSLYEEVGGLDHALGGVLDTELWLRMLRVAPSWGYVRRYMAAFRVHGAQKGCAWLDRILREQEELCRRHPEFGGGRWKARLGVTAYRTKELLRGRYIRERVLAAGLRGKPLASCGRFQTSCDEPSGEGSE